MKKTRFRSYMTLMITLMFIFTLSPQKNILAETVQTVGNWREHTDREGFKQGNGTEANPYEIATADQLAYLAERVNAGDDTTGKYYKLINDIDLGAHDWTPIGQRYAAAFRGHFDGNGKHIINLRNQRTVSSIMHAFGLFGIIENATVINTMIVNLDLSHLKDGYKSNEMEMGFMVGGIAGGVVMSDIINSGVTGKINAGKFTLAGGIVGGSEELNLVNCYSSVKISAAEDSEIGGVVGRAFYGLDKLENCYYDSSKSQILNGTEVNQNDKKGIGRLYELADNESYGEDVVLDGVTKDVTIPLNAEEMKANKGTSGALVDKLNKNREGNDTWSEWMILSTENEGYPVFWRKIATFLESIEITKKPTKLTYKLGEELDIDGLEVTGKYSDGTSKIETVTKENISGFDSSKAVENQKLTVTVNGKTASYNVSVEKANGKSISGVKMDDDINTISGLTKEMEFSTDGQNWTRYDDKSSNLPNLRGSVTLRVRYAETDTTKSGAIKTFNFTKEKTTTSKGSVVDKNGESVKSVSTKVVTEDNGNKTVEVKANEAVILKEPNGNRVPLLDVSKLGFEVKDNTDVSIAEDGTIKVKNLEYGTERKFEVTYDLGEGSKIVIGHMKVKVDDTGNVTFTSELIDPYGILTDSATGEAITGAEIKLYYADTSRNKDAGREKDTLVDLPIIDGFKPNNNKNPQISDALGAYGFMVFPKADYYVVVEKEGYDKFTSETISVEYEIVKYDIKMTKTKADSTGSKIADESEKTSDGEVKTNESTKSKAEGNNDSKEDKLVQTGTFADDMTLPIAGIIFLLAGVVLVRKKRKQA